MIWLAWRQSRAQVLTVAIVLLAFVIALLVTWGQVAGVARDAGLAGCQGGACDAVSRAMFVQVAWVLYYAGTGVLLVLPVLLGTFWGAPMVARELETGTYRFIFSQSVRRDGWLLMKLSIGGGAAALCAGLVSLVLTWWAGPVDRAGGTRIEPLIFTARGLVPIGYAALAFVLGVLIGLVLRRTLVAMAVTLLAVVAVQVGVAVVLPTVLARPVTTISALAPNASFGLSVDHATGEAHVDIDGHVPDGWVLSATAVTSTGADFHGKADPSCLPSPATPGVTGECLAWVRARHLSQKITYVPESEFWPLQWRGFGVLAVLAFGLAWFALWWIRRRLT